MLRDESNRKFANCKTEFAQDIDLAVDEELAKILDWPAVYHGADGRPYKVIGFIEEPLNLQLVFQRKIKDEKGFFNSEKIQVLTRDQMKGFGRWFFKKRTELLKMIVRNLLIAENALLHYNYHEDNKAIDEVKFLLSYFR